MMKNENEDAENNGENINSKKKNAYHREEA
jgi:hypothetical protein